MKILLKLFMFSLLWTLTFCAKKDNKTDEEKLLAYFVSSISQEVNHKLFKYQAGTPGVSAESQFLLAGTQNKTSKLKVIFIHGWDFTEKSSDPPTSDSKKIQNIKDTWGIAFKIYDETILNLANQGQESSYDVYAFTYRTADSILDNGKRLIDTLNANFVASDKVVIVAHSMGGLISRIALYHENNTSDVIDYIVSLGTPYYGSPFASSAYQNSSGVLGDLSSFATNSQGGKELGHTNTGNDTFITDAVNLSLDLSNEKTAKDNRIYPYAGNLGPPLSCSIAEGGDIYVNGCKALQSGSPTFLFSDGIVPMFSARMGNKVSSNYTIKAGFDHKMLSFRPESITTRAFFTEVITKVLAFTF
ncbi:MAG: alpha/beta hydrolase [Leptospiraceae bacterium]|nr:alpha/beta hydrolase [Leptospiraceae bacterium]MCP5500715.1 alpha/beta hydrolase [Leptospiraceae bacterium]